MKIIFWLFFFSWQFSALNASAELALNETTKPIVVETSNAEEEEEEEDPDIEIGEIALEFVNTAHHVVSKSLIGVSDVIDNFFVQERMEEEGSNTRVLFSYYVSDDVHGRYSYDYLFKARISLPKTQNRLRLVVESTVNPEEEEDKPLSASVEDERKLPFSTSLQFIFKKSKYWQVSSKTGVRFVIPPDPFTQLRIRRLYLYKDWIFRFVEVFFVSQSEGFGETSTLDIECELSEGLYFRSNSHLTIAEAVDETLFVKTFSIFQRITLKKYLMYSIGANLVVDNEPFLKRYYANIRFRHNFYQKWAFYEIVPELGFDRENQFDMLPVIFVKLDIVFGKI